MRQFYGVQFYGVQFVCNISSVVSASRRNVFCNSKITWTKHGTNTILQTIATLFKQIEKNTF